MLKKELFAFKYCLLRRAITMGKHLGGKKPHIYTRDESRTLCHEMEGKSIEELKVLHEIWIGYPYAA